MATLTPLSKGIIGLAVIGAVTSAVWHLGLKEQFAGNGETQQQSTPAPAHTPPADTAALQPPPPAKAAAAASTSSSANTAQRSAAENAEAGRQLINSGDYASARRHLEAAVQAGDGGAACLLGEMTLKGQGGITASQDNAAKLFQIAQSRNIICFTTGN